MIEGLDNGAIPAFPIKTEEDGTYWGLTKREAFVKAAMQGMIANSQNMELLRKSIEKHGDNKPMELFAKLSLRFADVHLAELEKPKP